MEGRAPLQAVVGVKVNRRCGRRAFGAMIGKLVALDEGVNGGGHQEGPRRQFRVRFMHSLEGC